MKVSIGPYKKNSERKASVRIDKHDLWSLNHTLAYVIHPALVAFKENVIGTPFTDIADCPQFSDDEEYSEKRWDWILSEMIWTFGQLSTIDADGEYFERQDWDGLRAYEDRIANGLRLFGRYYTALWQ